MGVIAGDDDLLAEVESSAMTTRSRSVRGDGVAKRVEILGEISLSAGNKLQASFK